MKYALIGCGRIAPNHIKAVLALPEVTEILLCDINRDSMEQVLALIPEEKRASVKLYSDYKELIKKDKPTFAAVTTESGKHAEIAIDCINEGIHLLVEKPMALSTHDTSRMIKAIETQKTTFAICHQNRFNPAVQLLKEALDQGRFGKLVNATARVLWKRDKDYYDQATWRGTWAQDGGTLMNQCIHAADLLQWVLGGEPETVAAMTRRAIRPIEAEDFGSVQIRFKNGAIGILEGTVCCAENVEGSLSVLGENGRVVIGGIAFNKLLSWNFKDSHPMDERAQVLDGLDSFNVYGKGHPALYRNFIEAMNNRTEPLIGAHEGAKGMKLVLAAYQSQLEGRFIDYDSLDFSTMQCSGMFDVL